MRGNCTNAGRFRLRAFVVGIAAALLALSAAACGSSSSDANQPSGTYRVKVVTAKFPTSQRLAQTSLLQIGVRNVGKKTLPALTVTASVAGNAGRDSALPFGYRDPSPGLAQPDRPIWVLAAHYPKLAGSNAPGGATTSNQKTFDFGPLKPGATTEAVWKLSAVKSGHYTLLYSVDAGLSGTAVAKTASGLKPGGSFVVDISSEPPNATVNDAGEIVEVGKSKPGGG